MISYIFIFLGTILFLYPKQRDLDENSFFTLIFSSIIFANLILAFISLILIHSNLSRFPIILVSLFITLALTLLDKKSINKIKKIKNNFFDLVRNFLNNTKNNNSSKIFIYLTLFLLIFIFLSSIGPIDHPDATDYHVGYPYQYFLRGGFFIDGGLHQGLLGIGDYANLAFIQEKSIWFIRPMQIINLPIIILYLSKKIKKDIFLIAFLSVPVFISWSTMAKPIFLGDTTLVILYLLWKESKSPYTLKFLLISILFCIGSKISGLIITLPILIDIGVNLFNDLNSNKKSLKDIKYIFQSKEFLIALIIIISLFLNRQIITGNFAYPLLTNIFNKNDIQKINFFENLKSYRDIFFFIKIFIPRKISEINGTIGPGILLIALGIFLEKFNNINSIKKDIFYVFLGQIFLLNLFCQGSAYYYSSPLILLIYQSKEIHGIFKKIIFKYLIYISITCQIFILLIYLLFSININFLTFLEYEKYMNSSAAGFFSSNKIDKNLKGNFVTFPRNTKFYYPINYITRDKMKKCIYDNKFLVENSQIYCLNKYNINQIITHPYHSIAKGNFKCEIFDSFQAGRNIFNRKKIKLKYCIRK